MKAFVVDKYKQKHALRLADMAEPTMGADDILVQVHAASVNPLDGKVRDGAFKLFLPYRPPFILGHDVAGTVVKVGARMSGASRWVMRFMRGRVIIASALSQNIIAIHESDVALKPNNLSMAEAASIPLVALTAWQALVEVGKVKPGQKVFIQAGSGGVGAYCHPTCQASRRYRCYDNQHKQC